MTIPQAVQELAALAACSSLVVPEPGREGGDGR